MEAFICLTTPFSRSFTEVLALSVHRSDAENALYRISRKLFCNGCRLLSNELVERDRKLTYPLSCSVEDRITDGCRYTIHSTLADPVRPELVDVRIRNPKTLDRDLRRISAAGHMIIREVSHDRPTIVSVEQCLFRKGGSKGKDGATH